LFQASDGGPFLIPNLWGRGREFGKKEGKKEKRERKKTAASQIVVNEAAFYALPSLGRKGGIRKKEEEETIFESHSWVVILLNDQEREGAGEKEKCAYFES